jgi:hypothetical protein
MSLSTNNFANTAYKNTGTGVDTEEEVDTSLHISKDTYDEFFREYIESVQNDASISEEEESEPVDPYIIERQRQMSEEYRAWLSVGLTKEDLDAYRQCVADIKSLQAYYLCPTQYHPNTPFRLLLDIVTYNGLYDERRRKALSNVDLNVNSDEEEPLLEEFNEMGEYSEEETEEERREWEEWIKESRDMDRERSWREEQRENF